MKKWILFSLLAVAGMGAKAQTTWQEYNYLRTDYYTDMSYNRSTLQGYVFVPYLTKTDNFGINATLMNTPDNITHAIYFWTIYGGYRYDVVVPINAEENPKMWEQTTIDIGKMYKYPELSVKFAGMLAYLLSNVIAQNDRLTAGR